MVLKKDLESHLHCPLCGLVGDSQAQANHALVCEERLITCKCGHRHKARDERTHKEECPMEPKKCPYCHLPFERAKFVEHEVR